MGDCCNMYGRCPDSEPKPSGQATVRQDFLKISLKIFPVEEPRPDGRTSAASNFHIRLRASGPWGMNVRTTILQHTISIFAMRASGP